MWAKEKSRSFVASLLRMTSLLWDVVILTTIGRKDLLFILTSDS
jgi:hypothetical protein